MNDLERDLIRVLRDQPPVAADPGLIDAVIARIGRQRKLRLAAAAAAMALVVGAAAAVAGTASKHGPARPAQSRHPNPAVTRVAVGQVSSNITALGADVWVYNQRGDLIRIDSRTNAVTLRVHVRGLASYYGAALASGDGRLWLAATSYRSWQADVLAINPVNGHVIARLNLGGTCYSRPNAPIMTYGAGHLWVSCWSVGNARRIVRIDPATGRVDATTGVIPGSGNEWIVAGQQGTWYCTDYSNITKVDPSGTRLTRVTVSDPWYPFSFCVAQLALGGGALWALTGDGTIVKIDPATGRIIRFYRHLAPDYTPGSATFAIGFGSVWVEGAALLRYSIRTGRVQAVVGSAGGGDILAISSDAVWISTQRGVIRVDPARLPG